jgi:hypothetical protein
MSTENVICPQLRIVLCGDTKEHNHLYCGEYKRVNNTLIDYVSVVAYCLARFDLCEYHPKNKKDG